MDTPIHAALEVEFARRRAREDRRVLRRTALHRAVRPRRWLPGWRRDELRALMALAVVLAGFLAFEVVAW